MNRPRSSLFTNKHVPCVSCQRILIRSPRRPRKTKRWPEYGSRSSTSCTWSASPFIPLRMSVRPVASQTRAPPGNGITARPARGAPPRPPPGRPRPSPDAVAARQLDLDQAGGHRRRRVRRRRVGRRDLDRGEAGHPRHRVLDPGPDRLAPGEELARADAAPPGDAVHRLPGCQRLLHQPALVILRPAPPRLPAKDLDHPLAPAPRLTTPRQTRRSGNPPDHPTTRKAAQAGRIRCSRAAGPFTTATAALRRLTGRRPSHKAPLNRRLAGCGGANRWADMDVFRFRMRCPQCGTALRAVVSNGLRKLKCPVSGEEVVRTRPAAGMIYVMSNANRLGAVKIGMTSKSVARRASITVALFASGVNAVRRLGARVARATRR
jgi:hypothetical protein